MSLIGHSRHLVIVDIIDKPPDWLVEEQECTTIIDEEILPNVNVFVIQSQHLPKPRTSLRSCRHWQDVCGETVFQISN